MTPPYYYLLYQGVERGCGRGISPFAVLVLELYTTLHANLASDSMPYGSRVHLVSQLCAYTPFLIASLQV